MEKVYKNVYIVVRFKNYIRNKITKKITKVEFLA